MKQKLNLTNKLRKAEREYALKHHQGGGENMENSKNEEIVSNRNYYDPKACYEDMIAMGHDKEHAKEFVNKQVRSLKALANNSIAREMAIMSGRNPDGWATLEEIA